MSKIIPGNIPGGRIPPTEQEQMAELGRLMKTADYVKCDSCGASNFLSIYRIRKISGLMSGSGKDVIIPIPVYACADCGHVNKKFLKSVGLDNEETPTSTKTDVKSSDLV